MMWGGGMSWFGWIFMTGFWVLAILAIVWLARTAVGSSGSDRESGRDRARRTLDERFAAGELSVEEYEERRRVLGRRT